MSPYSTLDYPVWVERTVRVIRAVMYLFAAGAGAGALVFTPASVKPEAFIIVGSMLVFGFLCAIGTATSHYILEWISLFFLMAGVSTYTVAIWISTLASPKSTAGACTITVLLLLMFLRLLELTVYWLRNVQAARMALELGHDD
jgi:hypothetical protein